MDVRNFATSLLVIFAVTLFSCTTDENKKESVDSGKAMNQDEKVTIYDVEQGIRENIERMTTEGDGYFNFNKDTTDLSLKLVRVHTEYLSVLGPNKFFACVDLATESGDVYDVDFFMDGTKEDMEVTRTDVHKLNGKPFYTWKQAKDKTWFTVPVKAASNDLLGVVEGTDEFIFTYKVDLPVIDKPSNIWIPIAQSDEYQALEITRLESPGSHRVIEDPDYGNSIYFLELAPEHSEKSIVIEYKVERKEKSPYEEAEPDFDQHLGSTPYLPVGDRFATIANDVIANKQAKSELEKARALYDYVIDEVRYAKQGIYGTGDANYACDSKSGNCTEFHSLFISLARSANIPSRFAVGAAIPSERDEGGVDGYHCWAEFYAEGKWWPVDISEANKYSALATYYFGHHPANRIEFTRGRELSPDPLPQSGPINFLAYPVMEVNGEPTTVKTTFTFKRNKTNS